ncbi:protein lin-54 homolog isoform X2 [Dendropsophus ebraccatus]|uniref:protein lin-54 homolog isoform X2 n=1 Tax=Dendropsophus ebraccatus TaxID=150705 RepID=UPI0038314AC7
MESYRNATYLADLGKLNPGAEVTQCICDHGCERSHVCGVPLYPSTTTQWESAITSPDIPYNHSGGCQYDDRLYPTFSNPIFGFIHPASTSDYLGESFRTLYGPCYDQYSPLAPAATSTTDSNFDKSDFQTWTIDDSRRLIPSPAQLCDSPYLQQTHCNSMVLCNNNSKILYVNHPDTGELKSYRVLSEYKERLHPPNPETTETVRRLSDGSEPAPVLRRGFLPVASMPYFTVYNMDSRAVYALSDDTAFHTDSEMEGALNLTLPRSGIDNKPKRSCRCLKSQCLKLYCECFANGEFCSNCSCINCFNNIYYESERQKAIKAYLDKNPEAFKPKLRTGNVKVQHTERCNCKRSGCLKNYCECYEAKKTCSSMCNCIACKNYEECPDQKYLENEQELADTESILRTCASIEVVRAACSCLLARAEVAEREHYSPSIAEQMVVEEFGQCLKQMLQKDLD